MKVGDRVICPRTAGGEVEAEIVCFGDWGSPDQPIPVAKVSWEEISSYDDQPQTLTKCIEVDKLRPASQ